MEFRSEDTDMYEDAWETLRMDWSTRARYGPRPVLMVFAAEEKLDS